MLTCPADFLSSILSTTSCCHDPFPNLTASQVQNILPQTSCTVCRGRFCRCEAWDDLIVAVCPSGQRQSVVTIRRDAMLQAHLLWHSASNTIQPLKVPDCHNHKRKVSTAQALEHRAVCAQGKGASVRTFAAWHAGKQLLGSFAIQTQYRELCTDTTDQRAARLTALCPFSLDTVFAQSRQDAGAAPGGGGRGGGSGNSLPSSGKLGMHSPHLIAYITDWTSKY